MVAAELRDLNLKKETRDEEPSANTRPSIPEQHKPKIYPPETNATLSSDPRFRPFVGFVTAEFKSAFDQEPALAPKDFKSLKDLLRRTQADGAELQRRYLALLHSDNKFHASANGSLSHFCAHFDQFVSRAPEVRQERFL